MLNALDGPCVFPPEFVSPKVKETNEYGLAYAKAIYYSSSRYGGTYYYGSSEFDDLVALAQGRQSVSNIRKLFGYFVDPNNPLNDGSSAMSWIDIQVLNLVPKYVNRAVAKMMKLAYDVGVQAIDIVSNDEKQTLMAAVGAFYRLKGSLEGMGFNPQDFFPELDVASLPQYQDELIYDMTVNPKIKKEISGELTIKLLHAINRFPQKMRQVAWDMVVVGSGHTHEYLDNNGIPRVDRINPKFAIGSYVDNDDFEDQEYAGFYDFITVNQFLKESSGDLTEEEQMAVIRRHGATTPQNSMFLDYRRTENFDGLEYIPVLRFYYRSEDNRTFSVLKTKYGNEFLAERNIDYTPTTEKEKETRTIKNSYTSIYGGTWVVDSDCIYNYGRKEYPRQKLVNATLPIKTFKTNHREGRVVSFVAQIIEPMYMINVCWNKIKEILAQGYMGILEIDFNQIENIAMGSGGNVWTGKDVIEFFLKKKILVKRGQTNKYDQNTNSDGVAISPSGLTLEDYWRTLSECIRMLDQMTGTSVTESSNIPDRLSAKGAELSQMNADVDMEYLFNGYEYLYERTSHQLLLLAQESMANGNTIKDFIPALGKANTGFFDVPKDIAYCEYGMFLTKQASAEEWADFLGDVKNAVLAGLNGTAGGISLTDSAYIREINNLKQARQILAIRQGIYERKTQEQAQINQEYALQANSQAAELKMQGEVAKIQAKRDADIEVAKLNADIQAKQSLQDQNFQLSLKQIEMDREAMIQNTINESEVLKQAVRNKPLIEKNEVDANKAVVEAFKDDKKLETERIRDEKKLEVDKMKAKQKPKTPAKK